MLLLQIPLQWCDTDFFTTLLTQVLQEEEICCHKTLANFQWPGFVVADFFTTLLQTQILQDEQICCESVW
jgi:hypothetical protein